MKKRFNITGKCMPAQNYMADVSKKLAKTLDLIEIGAYFTINRPRQYGKTTLLDTLRKTLTATNDYAVFSISFGGIGDAIFDDEAVFSAGFVRVLATHAKYYQLPEMASWLHDAIQGTDSLEVLSDVITQLVSQTDKKVVLFIASPRFPAFFAA